MICHVVFLTPTARVSVGEEVFSYDWTYKGGYSLCERVTELNLFFSLLVSVRNYAPSPKLSGFVKDYRDISVYFNAALCEVCAIRGD